MTIKEIFQSIDRKEWRFLIIIAIALIIITSIPAIYGYLTASEDSHFLGLPFLNRNDYANYLSYIGQAKSGHLLFKDLYTTEPQPRIILNVFFLGLGIIAKTLRLSALQIFHLSRIVLIPIFLLAIYLFLSLLFRKKVKRKIGLILICFSSGLGVWFLPWLSHLSAWRQPMDLWIPEAITFLTLYTNPLFIFSLSLITLVFFLMLLALKNKNYGYALGAGLLGLLLFQVHPYHFPTVLMILGFFWVGLSFKSLLKEGRINWLFFKYCLIFILVSSPSLVYYWWLSSTHWLTTQRIIQAYPAGFTANGLVFLVSYGLLLPLALIGIFSFLQKKRLNNIPLFLIIWLMVQVFLIYSPLPLQRRMSEGLHIVICFLATSGIFFLYQEVKKRISGFKLALVKNKFLWIIVFLLFFTLSNIYILTRDILFAKHPYFSIPEEIIKGMEYLNKNSPEKAIILSPIDIHTANLIPAFTVRRVYAGHGVETAYFLRKKHEVFWFFTTNNNDKDKQDFLKKNKIDYVFFYKGDMFFTETESIKGENILQPQEKQYLEEVFKKGKVSIYKTSI